MRTYARLALAIGAAALFAGCGALRLGAPGAMPQTSALATRGSSTNYKIVHSFGASPDGVHPTGSLTDVNGTLYGTTAQGGANTCGSSGCGTVFSITTSGSEKVLYSFGTAPDGNDPRASLLDVGGSLYGTTSYGGPNKCSYYSCGTVFRVSMGGKEKVLHSFDTRPDGSDSTASLIALDGMIYGTTAQGGANDCGSSYGCGTVFSITTGGSEKVLSSFGPHHNANDPCCGLVNIRRTLYGTTYGGGAYRGGTVFSITRNGAIKVLHSFGSGDDGKYPFGALVASKGVLYGTTVGGGPSCGSYGASNPCGTFFSITPDGTEKVIYRFGSVTDGQGPRGGLVEVKGIFYGTTYGGGAFGTACCGTVFSVTKNGTEKVLHSFGYGTKGDGIDPEAGLINVNGTLYGTTTYGGANGNGTVYSLTP